MSKLVFDVEDINLTGCLMLDSFERDYVLPKMMPEIESLGISHSQHSNVFYFRPTLKQAINLCEVWRKRHVCLSCIYFNDCPDTVIKGLLVENGYKAVLGGGSPIMRVAPGTYALREWVDAKPQVAAVCT